jgi:type I restriction enzyme M protein
VDQLWDKLWTGGLTNPMDAIEQFSYLLFLKRLDELEEQTERRAKRLNRPYAPTVPAEMRWRSWTHYTAEESLNHLKGTVFPWFRQLGDKESSFQQYMRNAECKINRGSLLIESCRLIDQMKISEQNQDVQGDLYEYLLSKLNTAGRNGQFRTPRHVIRMMVEMLDPRPHERIGDLAAGTGGFLINAYQHILRQHTTPDAQGRVEVLVGDQLSQAQREFLQRDAFRGYDNDSGMTMLRIGSMNMILHGINQPRFFYADTLAGDFSDSTAYDVILMKIATKVTIDPTRSGDAKSSVALD